MAPITRSQARKTLDHHKSSPYHAAFIAKVKSEFPHATDKLENLLEREKTPDVSEILDSYRNLVSTVMKEYDKVTQRQNESEGLHVMGDILYKSLTPLRKYIFKNTSLSQNTSSFIKSWEDEGVDGVNDDSTVQANIIKNFIKKDAPKKAQDTKYLQASSERWKTWLMYYQRCELVHGGLDEMSPQDLWDNLKLIEEKVNSGNLRFKHINWQGYAIQAIHDLRSFKFEPDNKGGWQGRDPAKTPIIP